MKKILKTALVIFAIALMSAGCSKIKTTSLIGTYKNGTSKMIVMSDGIVNFIIPSDATGVLLTLNQVKPANLVPWDVTSEKSQYSFSDKVEGYDNNNNSTYSADISFKFSKDGKSIKCDVDLKVPEGKGESGSVSFTK